MIFQVKIDNFKQAKIENMNREVSLNVLVVVEVVNVVFSVKLLVIVVCFRIEIINLSLMNIEPNDVLVFDEKIVDLNSKKPIIEKDLENLNYLIKEKNDSFVQKVTDKKVKKIET